MSIGLSVAWERLMKAPWGKSDPESVKAKADALAEYDADWAGHSANPRNQTAKNAVVTDGSDIEID